MSVLRNFPAIPNRIAVGCEFLQMAGERGVSRDEFDRALGPLKGKDDDEDVKPGTTMASLVLGELLALGIAVAREDGTIRLASGYADEPLEYSGWRDALVPRLRHALVVPEVADDVDQRGVPDVLAWFLCQDPVRPIRRSGQHAELLARQFRAGEGLLFRLGNDQLFQNLIYWARYIGFAETFAFSAERDGYVIPDPTRAIRAELPAAFADTEELPVATFVERLAEALPVLENGSVRTAIEARLQAQHVRAIDHFSRSTSLGLSRLALSGELELIARSDAPPWVVKNGRDVRTVSHVRMLGANR